MYESAQHGARGGVCFCVPTGGGWGILAPGAKQDRQDVRGRYGVGVVATAAPTHVKSRLSLDAPAEVQTG